MKIICLILVVFLITVTGCTKRTISENEFAQIWQEYLKKEFEESFDEKQSTSQREKLLEDVLKNYELRLEEFKEYIMKEHNDKYKKIFLK